MAWTLFLAFIVSIPGTIFGLAGLVFFMNSSEHHLKQEEQGMKIITGIVMIMLSAVFIYFTHRILANAGLAY
jgi:hypothetical protein